MHTPFSLMIFACCSMLMAAQVLAAVPLKPSRGENQVVKFRDCPSCPLMVAVPAGQFDMGSPDSEEGRADDEGPVHSVAIHAFAVSKTEITRGQFAAFVTKSKYRSGVECLTLEEGKVAARAGSWRELIYGQSDNYPIGCISWNDAKAYTAWLSRITGKKYRLPSEAEWEYAARSNTRTARYWGDNPDDACAYANGADQTAQAEIQGASSWTTHACADSFAYTAPVASLKRNAFGLNDMLGNVWEWTEDSYHPSYVDAPSDGGAWSGDGVKRVLRGGSWNNSPRNMRAAVRNGYLPVSRYSFFGFRVVRVGK
ncbi:MAG: formylglycine-generating enzyme family protein [Gallionella sp.]|nr:formylglycine-generating enzyme family protein [Gallionella sp.]